MDHDAPTWGHVYPPLDASSIDDDMSLGDVLAKNDKVLRHCAQELESPATFTTCVRARLVPWLGSPRAYYQAVRMTIVGLLQTAQKTLMLAVGHPLDKARTFCALSYPDCQLTAPYIELVRVVQTYFSLFTEPDLIQILHKIFASIQSPPQLVVASTQNLIGKADQSNIGQQIPLHISMQTPDTMHPESSSLAAQVHQVNMENQQNQRLSALVSRTPSAGSHGALQNAAASVPMHPVLSASVATPVFYAQPIMAPHAPNMVPSNAPKVLPSNAPNMVLSNAPYAAMPLNTSASANPHSEPFAHPIPQLAARPGSISGMATLRMDPMESLKAPLPAALPVNITGSAPFRALPAVMIPANAPIPSVRPTSARSAPSPLGASPTAYSPSVQGSAISPASTPTSVQMFPTANGSSVVVSDNAPPKPKAKKKKKLTGNLTTMSFLQADLDWYRKDKDKADRASGAAAGAAGPSISPAPAAAEAKLQLVENLPSPNQAPIKEPSTETPQPKPPTSSSAGVSAPAATTTTSPAPMLEGGQAASKRNSSLPASGPIPTTDLNDVPAAHTSNEFKSVVESVVPSHVDEVATLSQDVPIADFEMRDISSVPPPPPASTGHMLSEPNQRNSGTTPQSTSLDVVPLAQPDAGEPITNASHIGVEAQAITSPVAQSPGFLHPGRLSVGPEQAMLIRSTPEGTRAGDSVTTGKRSQATSAQEQDAASMIVDSPVAVNTKELPDAIEKVASDMSISSQDYTSPHGLPVSQGSTFVNSVLIPGIAPSIPPHSAPDAQMSNAAHSGPIQPAHSDSRAPLERATKELSVSLLRESQKPDDNNLAEQNAASMAEHDQEVASKPEKHANGDVVQSDAMVVDERAPSVAQNVWNKRSRSPAMSAAPSSISTRRKSTLFFRDDSTVATSTRPVINGTQSMSPHAKVNGFETGAALLNGQSSDARTINETLGPSGSSREASHVPVTVKFSETINLSPSPSTLAWTATALEPIVAGSPSTRFKSDMYIACARRGTLGGPITMKFMLTDGQWNNVVKWNNRNAKNEAAPDITGALCLSLACYSSKELQTMIKQRREPMTQLVKSCQSEWPKHGGLSMSVKSQGSTQAFLLSPPLNVTPDSLVDYSPFATAGENIIELDQRRSLANYTFCLHVHPPTPAQIQEVTRDRQLNDDWMGFLRKASQPFSLHHKRLPISTKT